MSSPSPLSSNKRPANRYLFAMGKPFLLASPVHLLCYNERFQQRAGSINPRVCSCKRGRHCLVALLACKQLKIGKQAFCLPWVKCSRLHSLSIYRVAISASSDEFIWKILGCCCNTKRHCRNAPYCRNIAAIPCNGHCRNVAATLQLQLHCRSIAAIPCCCNIAAMGPLLQYAVRIAAIRNASTHCHNIAAMTCCRNVAAMPSGIADYLKAPGPFAHFAALP